MSDKINFTKKTIDDLVYSPTKSIYYYDDKIPHHRLVVTRKGRKTFQIYMRIDGKPVKRTLGVYPDLSPEKARELAKTTISKMIMGDDDYTEKQRRKKEPTYAEIWQDYFAYLIDKANQKPKTAKKNIGQQLSIFNQCKEFHNLQLYQITTDKLIKFHRYYSLDKGRKTAANNILRQIRACFNYAHYEPNPAVSTKIKLNKQNKRKKYLRAEEIQAFVNATLQDESHDFRDIFLLCLFTAARIGSIMSMEWKELKLEYNIWEPVTKASDTETDIIPIGLNNRAVEILKRRKKLNTTDSKWVFPANTKTGYVTQPQKAFKRICKRANLEDFKPHDLRRSAISHYAQNGASDHELLTLLGNKTFDTREVYAQRNVIKVNSNYNDVLDGILKDVIII